MNKIILSRVRLLQNPQQFEGWTFNTFKRFYAKDDDVKEDDVENKSKIQGKGILHDKQQSLQEESYFHKEEAEKLRELKKKITNKQQQKDEKKD